MFYTILSNLANWLTSPLVHSSLVIVTCLILQKASGRKSLVSKAIIGIFLGWLFFCTLPYTSSILIHRLEHHYPVIDYDDNSWKSADAIVVLACSFYDDDKLPLTSKWHSCALKRNLQAVLMYREKRTPIYLSGGNVEGSDYTHARFNSEFFKEMDIPETDIILSECGKNTKSETEALIPKLQGKTIALVTSASHQVRAIKYFENKNISVIPIPVEHLTRFEMDFIIGLPSSRNLYRSERAIHEYLGLLTQKVLL